ncbi:MAG: alanine racemase [Candidatus Thermoplasmatota archaeon]|nr:alanine racemase [Candidatus Thermoplasmatota archaeon]
MQHSSRIELSQSALKKNIRYLKKQIGESVKFVSVVKGNAYGHGIKEFVPMAEACGVDYFAVFDAYESEIVVDVKQPKTEIMIMGMIANEDISWAIKHDVSFFVFEFSRLEHAIKTAKKLKKKVKIHLEVETGLHRTGFGENELKKAVRIIKHNLDHISIEGVCTHFAGAESIANYVRVHNQIDRFNEVKQWLIKNNIVPKYYHMASSAAALIYPETRMNMVRVGIAQYGYWPSDEIKMHNLLSGKLGFTHNPLKRIMTWKSRVMGIEYVKPGEFVSYGNFFQARKNTKIATVPVGYFHGYRRRLSNVGYVLIKGKKAPIIGMVNMSVMIADVTSIPLANKGDEVVLIGKQGSQTITVASFSELSNLVNYELLVRLPMQIPRIVKKS